MNLTDINALARELPSPSRETLEKYLPVLLAILVAWLFARGLKKMFWIAFGLFWAFHWAQPVKWLLQ